MKNPYKIYKKEEYYLGDWCYVSIILFKSNLNGKYIVRLVGNIDLIDERLEFESSYKELKFATICYDNWRSNYIEIPKELEKTMGESKLKERYMEVYKAL